MRAGVAIILALLVVGVGGWALWDRIAVMAAPKKEAIASRSEAASKADECVLEHVPQRRIRHDTERT